MKKVLTCISLNAILKVIGVKAIKKENKITDTSEFSVSLLSPATCGAGIDELGSDSELPTLHSLVTSLTTASIMIHAIYSEGLEYLYPRFEQ